MRVESVGRRGAVLDYHKQLTRQTCPDRENIPNAVVISRAQGSSNSDGPGPPYNKLWSRRSSLAMLVRATWINKPQY
jgi:hypothetical protein